MITTLAGLALTTLSAWAPPAAANDVWIPDFDQAVEVARKEGKDLLVDFTGSDWCGWCIKLHDEVFGHDEFIQEAQKHFVLVALDFPRKEEVKAKVPNPKRNAELRDKYEVQGYPTVLLMSPAGEVFAATGYQPGGVEKYLAHLDEITASGKKDLTEVRNLIAEFEKAQGEAKVAQWEKILQHMGELPEGSPFVAQLAKEVRWAFEADPKNEKGLKGRAVEALLDAHQVDDAVKAAGREIDPDNKKGLLERIVEAQFMTVGSDEDAKAAIGQLDSLTTLGFHDNQIGFRLNFFAAQWLNGPLKDPQTAKKYALAAKEIGTDDEQMMSALDSLLDG